MDGAARSAIRKTLVITLVVVALCVGYLVHGGLDASTHRPSAAPVATRKLTPADLLLAATTAQGIHLRLSGVTTGALNNMHSNDIQITSFQFGTSRSFSSPASGTRQGSTPNISEITLTHQTDNYSIALLNKSLRGDVPGVPASLYFSDASGPGGAAFDYLQIDLTQTVISSFSMSSGGDHPSESLSLNFVTMTFTYRVTGTTTVQKVSWNIATGS
jgi:type VI secretion system secreted protein Hcp